MTLNSDRTVHARSSFPSGNCCEIVRYDRAGKWFQELTVRGEIVKRVPMDLRRAVMTALSYLYMSHVHSAQVFYGKPGGRVFDARVRKELRND